jgi:anti-sigma factor RsiW
MCENRERLIGYVYDEGDQAERQLIEEHLESCPTCREEIRGLRGVRQDLLAWDVPASAPIWRPMAPALRQPVWRAVPTWALAAAACATFMVGAAGGAATVALMPQAAPAVAERQAPVESPVSAAVSRTDLAALEAKVIARMRLELETRATAAAAVPRNVANGSAEANDLARRVNVLSNRQEELYGLLLDFASQTDGIRIKQSGLERDQRMLVSYMQGGTAGISGGQ